MKQITIGVFGERSEAESAIGALVKDLSISPGDISYLYRNTNDVVRTVTMDGTSENTETASEGAVSGAMTGGTIGALAGLATVAGLIPVIGPIFVAGPLIAALGFGTGAIATTAAATAAGGLIGAFATLGVSDTRAKEYEERINAGDTLVSVSSENSEQVSKILTDRGASTVGSYTSPM
jgi:outer membrane lipoprotein SlyB